MATATVIVDCGRIVNPDLHEVHCLARETLHAKRKGFDSRLMFASRELLRLIAFAGLEGVLRAVTGFPPRSSGYDDLTRPGAEAAQTAGTAAPYPGRT